MAGTIGFQGLGQDTAPHVQTVPLRPEPPNAVARTDGASAHRDSQSERNTKDSERRRDASARVDRVVYSQEGLARAAMRRPAASHPTGAERLEAAELRRDAYREAAEAAAERRATQPGPAEILGLPDALMRYDTNADGRLDHLELRRVVNAKDPATPFAARALPQLAERGDTFEPPKRLFEGEPVGFEQPRDEAWLPQDLAALGEVPSAGEPNPAAVEDAPVPRKLFGDDVRASNTAAGAYSAAFAIADQDDRHPIVA